MAVSFITIIAQLKLENKTRVCPGELNWFQKLQINNVDEAKLKIKIQQRYWQKITIVCEVVFALQMITEKQILKT